jgi:hypothetical protein
MRWIAVIFKSSSKLQLQTRAEHLSSLGETLNQLVSDQAKSIGNLNDMREEMSKSETEYLTNQNEEIQSIANERMKIVKNFQKVFCEFGC